MADQKYFAQMHPVGALEVLRTKAREKLGRGGAESFMHEHAQHAAQRLDLPISSEGGTITAVGAETVREMVCALYGNPGCAQHTSS